MPTFEEILHTCISQLILEGIVPLIKKGKINKDTDAEDINEVIKNVLELKCSTFKAPTEIKDKKKNSKPDRKQIPTAEEFHSEVKKLGVPLCAYVPSRGKTPNVACGIVLDSEKFDLDDPNYYINWRCSQCSDPKTNAPKEGKSAEFFGKEASKSKTKKSKGKIDKEVNDHLMGKHATVTPSTSVAKPFDPKADYGKKLTLSCQLFSNDTYVDATVAPTNGLLPFVFRVERNDTSRKARVIGKLRHNCFASVAERDRSKENYNENKLLPLTEDEIKFITKHSDDPEWRNVYYQPLNEEQEAIIDEEEEMDIDEPHTSSPKVGRKQEEEDDDLLKDLGLE